MSNQESGLHIHLVVIVLIVRLFLGAAVSLWLERVPPPRGRGLSARAQSLVSVIFRFVLQIRSCWSRLKRGLSSPVSRGGKNRKTAANGSAVVTSYLIIPGRGVVSRRDGDALPPGLVPAAVRIPGKDALPACVAIATAVSQLQSLDLHRRADVQMSLRRRRCTTGCGLGITGVDQPELCYYWKLDHFYDGFLSELMSVQQQSLGNSFY